MLGTEIITEIRSLLDEPAAVAEYFTDTELLAWWNRYYIEFVNKTNCIYDETNIYMPDGSFDNDVETVANVAQVTLPINFKRVNPWKGVWWGDWSSANALYPRELSGAAKQQMDEEGRFYRINSVGVPQYYELSTICREDGSRIIELYPYPDAVYNYLKVYYTPIIEPIELLDAPLLEAEDIYSIIDRTVSVGKGKRQLMDEAGYYKNQYDIAVAQKRIDLMDLDGSKSDSPTKPWLRYAR